MRKRSLTSISNLFDGLNLWLSPAQARRTIMRTIAGVHLVKINDDEMFLA